MSNLYLKIGNSSTNVLYMDKIFAVNNISKLKKFHAEKIIYYYTNPKVYKKYEKYLILKKGVEFKKNRIKLIKNGYKDPKEIGTDRLLGASFFYRKYKKDLIFVDLGTAITVNIVRDGTLVGGYILPGAKNYFSSMNKIGVLPLVTNKEIILEPGKTTKENIRNGYFLLLISFFDKIKKRENLPLYSSGGDKTLIKLGKFDEYEANADLKEMQNYEED